MNEPDYEALFRAVAKQAAFWEERCRSLERLIRELAAFVQQQERVR